MEQAAPQGDTIKAPLSKSQRKKARRKLCKLHHQVLLLATGSSTPVLPPANSPERCRPPVEDLPQLAASTGVKRQRRLHARRPSPPAQLPPTPFHLSMTGPQHGSVRSAALAPPAVAAGPRSSSMCCTMGRCLGRGRTASQPPRPALPAPCTLSPAHPLASGRNAVHTSAMLTMKGPSDYLPPRPCLHLQPVRKWSRAVRPQWGSVRIGAARPTRLVQQQQQQQLIPPWPVIMPTHRLRPYSPGGSTWTCRA